MDLVAKAAVESGSPLVTTGEGGRSMSATVEGRGGFQATAVSVVAVEARSGSS